MTVRPNKDLTKEMQKILDDEDYEELDPSSGSIHAGNPSRLGSENATGVTAKPNCFSPPSSLHLTLDGEHSYSGVPTTAEPFRGPSGVDASDSPTNIVSPSWPANYMGVPKAKSFYGTSASSCSPSTSASTAMIVTSPEVSGTSWTGGLTYGCSAAFKTGKASTTVTLGRSEPSTPSTKFEAWKNWTVSTYKCSRQSLYEKLGKTTRTVDTELEAQIESLRDTQRKYVNILRLARALTSHFQHVVQTQSALGECFGDLSHKSPELQEEFLYNAETQRSLTKNGETLISALNFFVSSVNTLCNKTMEDTIVTVKQYEAARVEFDAYRSDLDFYATATQSETVVSKHRETEKSFNKQKKEFEKLRSDVQIKLKFLEENRVKVMHQQLLLFHNAVAAYFSGNQNALQATMKQFSIKVKNSNKTATHSWIAE